MSTEQLCNILVKMDIPVQRKYTMNKNNLLWLQKHLAERNSNHKNYDRAIAEINRRIDEKIYEN